MKLIPLLPVVLSLLLPATAHAIDRPSGTICDTRTGQGSTCFTISPGDSYLQEVGDLGVYATWANFVPSTGAYQMGQGGCTYAYSSKDAWIQHGSPKTPSTCVPVMTTGAGHQFDKYLKDDIPQADRDSSSRQGNRLPIATRLSVGERYGEGVFIKRTGAWVTIVTSSPTALLEGTCNFYRYYEDGSPTRYALDTTPQSVYDACFAGKLFDGHLADRPAVTPPADPKPPTPTTNTITVPSSAARCGTTSGVNVRSVRVSCAPARTIMSRYAKTLRSPAGWSCRMVVTDSTRRGSCVRKQSGKAARATVYGLWRGRS